MEAFVTMEVITSLKNLRTGERKLLGKLPRAIPQMHFKRGDKFVLKVRIDNDTDKDVDTRVEFWVGNRLYGSRGRDSVDHVSQTQWFIEALDFDVLKRIFIVAERDLNATITVGTLFNYKTTDHRNIKLVLDE